MNIIFAGTPAFSAVTLAALIASEHKITAVYTQPDRPAGRGQLLQPSPVKQLALEHQLPVFQPLTLRELAEQRLLADLQADVMIVVAYGLLLPRAVLTALPLGCINIHASLLPRWRGAAPIQRAILAGDQVTGITIMQMDEGLDTGPMLYKVTCPIYSIDTTGQLHDRLAKMGAEAILYTLNNLKKLTSEPQDDTFATYAKKIKKEEAEIQWALPATEIACRIRAFNPWPVAFFGRLRIWEAEVISQKTSAVLPGTIVRVSSQGIEVMTGEGILRLLKLQLPGGKVLAAADLLNARKTEFAVGTMLSLKS